MVRYPHSYPVLPRGDPMFLGVLETSPQADGEIQQSLEELLHQM